LEPLKKSGTAAPDVIEDYELYLSRVQAIVAENRKKVAKMEMLHARYDTLKSSDGSAPGGDAADMLDPAIPEEQAIDEVAWLDRQLDASLYEFDEILLTELDLIRAKSSERMQDLAADAAAAAERLREKGIEIDNGSGEDTQEFGQDSSGEQKETTEAAESAAEGGKEAQVEAAEETAAGGKAAETEKGREDGEVSTTGKSWEGVEGSAHHPKNRYEPEKDDIVARQLREAAEMETDPQLKEKLWKEYEQYKKNTGS
ncbi:MAG: hypothetical protein JRF27_05230, partial [Deltaproteobacteria bacterium]|nr:hypothetical protein [Deltaproteobacteria bacterium]